MAELRLQSLPEESQIVQHSGWREMIRGRGLTATATADRDRKLSAGFRAGLPNRRFVGAARFGQWSNGGGAALCVWASILLVATPARAASFEEALSADRAGNDQVAADSYRAAAERGDMSAEYALGRMYLQGRGISQSDAQAIVWFRKAAEQGDPGAEFELSIMLRAGRGEPRNAAEATEWLEKAASAGFAPAELELSISYELGEGVSKDLDQALTWATKAAEQGDVEAQFTAGRLYARVARDEGHATSLTSAQFYAAMDSLFGKAKWRQTSGYRTRAEEDELRKEGAGTVPAGVLSRHSIGTRQAPGAYDIVVTDLSMQAAALRLRKSAVKFRRIVVESAHGPEGPHLHIEPWLTSEQSWSVNQRSLTDVAPPAQKRRSSADEQAVYWLELAAWRGSTPARTILRQIGRSAALPLSAAQIGSARTAAAQPEIP